MSQPHDVKNKKGGLPPIAYICLGLLLIFLVPRLSESVNKDRFSSSDRASIGNRLLIQKDASADKQKGIEAFAKGDRKSSIEHFKNSLLFNPNDPEAVIYLNNAQAGDRFLKIAVSVPIGNNPNIAQEILRGVAQAQDEINQQGGINGQKLLVEIVNDENKPEIARQVAEQLVNDSQVLAVVGHNASDASLAAAPIYQKGGLVMVSPTSFANNLSGIGNYIFRTVLTTKVTATALANYTVKTAKQTKIAFCYDSQAPDNVSFKDEFQAAFVSKGGQLVPTVCDLSAPNFNPSEAVNQAISSGADGLFISPHIDRLQAAIALAKANWSRLALYSSPTMYTVKTLEAGQQDVKGLVLAAPWHPQANEGNSFADKMSQRWRGKVSWRSATAYDATRAVIAGLKQSNTRDGLQQVLRSPGFAVEGAGVAVRFSPSGDRIGQPVIIQVQSKGSVYEFVKLPTAD